MNSFFSRYKAQFLLFLAVLGPGIITAMADNDAGGVATYSVAASLYGMASQYFIVLTTILLAISQEAGARIAIVTGKGLGDLIREIYGVKVAVAIFFVYFFVNLGVVVQNVAGLKSAIILLNLPWFSWDWWLSFLCLFLILLVIKLNYKNLQRIFLLTILFYGVYLFSAVLAKPNWGEAVKNSLIWPSSVGFTDLGYWFTLVAVLGTTVTAWGQFFVNSYVADKGLKPENLKEAKLEIYLGAILTNVFSWLIAVAVTYTLFVKGVQVTDGATAALAIQPVAGHLTYILFAVGLLAASVLGLTIVPLATAYVFTELFGYERSLNSNFNKGKVFYNIFIGQIALALGISLFQKINLFNLTLYADFLNGLLLPVIFYFLIRFSENPKIMGEQYVSRGFSKFFLRSSALVIFFAVVVSVYGKLFSS